MIGRTVIPGICMSISRNEMPCCFFGALGSVRTRQKHQSASCAVEVQIFWPLTMYSSPSRRAAVFSAAKRSEEHTSELQSQSNLVCRLLLEKKSVTTDTPIQTQQ